MKILLIDAINGVGLPTIELAVAYEKMGMSKFTGNQHNPDWAWRQDYLDQADEQTLQNLYESLRMAREELRSKYAGQ